MFQNVYQTSDTQKLVIIWFYLLIWKSYWTLSENSSIHYHQQVDYQKETQFTLNDNQERLNELIKRATLQFKTVDLIS